MSTSAPAVFALSEAMCPAVTEQVAMLPAPATKPMTLLTTLEWQWHDVAEMLAKLSRVSVLLTQVGVFALVRQQPSLEPVTVESIE